MKPAPINHCVPSPCGPYSECRDLGGAPSCSCRETYIGTPPNCRPECISSNECASNLACIREKCKDPCPGSCGTNAECTVQNHTPICTCINGYIGDPFVTCHLAPVQRKILYLPVYLIKPRYITTFIEDEPPADPCNPSPCGSNAVCKDGICSCSPNYHGDPYTGCRPECVLSNDCPRDKACIRNKCVDPCPGTCGHNAVCTVLNHIPICSCNQGSTGNAFVLCSPIPGK